MSRIINSTGARRFSKKSDDEMDYVAKSNSIINSVFDIYEEFSGVF